jgi:hypothetical protein
MRRSAFFLAALLLFATPAMASIIKKPPVKTAELAYKDIPCTEEHKACIYEIISTMAENSKLSLLFNQSHLKGLGDQISDVHPMKFLSTIFNDPHLKMCMNLIWNDYFKRNGFLDGLGPSLTREMEKGKLTMHIPDFAQDVGVEAEHLRPYFNAQDWENLVLFLIQS